METPVREKGRKRYRNEEESKQSTPSRGISSSDDGDSPIYRYKSEMCCSPPVILWESTRPKASPETVAEAKRIGKELKQHLKARRRAPLKLFDDSATSEKEMRKRCAKSIEKYAQNLIWISKRMNDINQNLDLPVRLPDNCDKENEEITTCKQLKKKKCSLTERSAPHQSLSDSTITNDNELRCSVLKGHISQKKNMETTTKGTQKEDIQKNISEGTESQQNILEFDSDSDDFFRQLNF